MKYFIILFLSLFLFNITKANETIFTCKPVYAAVQTETGMFYEETLEEMDIQYRSIANKFGIVNFRRVRALDTYPMFIQGLADLVEDCLEGRLRGVPTARHVEDAMCY